MLNASSSYRELSKAGWVQGHPALCDAAAAFSDMSLEQYVLSNGTQAICLVTATSLFRA